MRISDWSSDVCSSDLYTPSGRSVQEGGVTPDIPVPQLSDPDYKDRPRLREADLRRHLINEAKVDDSLLKDDLKDDPRFAATAEALKKQGIEDYQPDYAIKTIARIAAPAQATAAWTRRDAASRTCRGGWRRQERVRVGE